MKLLKAPQTIRTIIVTGESSILKKGSKAIVVKHGEKNWLILFTINENGRKEPTFPMSIFLVEGRDF